MAKSLSTRGAQGPVEAVATNAPSSRRTRSGLVLRTVAIEEGAGVQVEAGPLPAPAREGVVGSAAGSPPDGSQKEPDQGIREERKIMVHYMPWYSSKPFSAQWGWHWTMNHFNPDKVTKGGGRGLAREARLFREL